MSIQLGDIARDSVTSFEGVVIARTDWLHGCRRLTIQPQALHDGKPIEPVSFDEPQCVLVRARPHELSAVPPSARKTGGPRSEPARR